MRDRLYPFVPMLVHQIGDDTTRSLRQVGVNLLSALTEGNLLDIGQLLFIGREEVVREPALDVSHLTTVRTIGSHRPDLRSATLRGDVADATALLDPASAMHASDTLGDLAACTAIGGDGEELGADLIVLDAGEAHAVDDRLAVGREGGGTDTSERKHRLGRHVLRLLSHSRQGSREGCCRSKSGDVLLDLHSDMRIVCVCGLGLGEA